MVTDTPATTPATTANMLVDWPLGMAGREFYESGFRDGHAAGVAAERQRLRQWTIDHHATWGAIVRQFPAAIADLLAGGGQDT